VVYENNVSKVFVRSELVLLKYGQTLARKERNARKIKMISMLRLELSELFLTIRRLPQLTPSTASFPLDSNLTTTVC
jgi:hypothetical protein